MRYQNESLKKYFDDLAAKLPAPGGGSAAALTAASGAALLSMVINFTCGKPKYAQYEEELKVSGRESEKLGNEFLNLVDLDVAAFESKNIREALEVPLKVCRLCLKAIELCPMLIEKGNINLISDVAVAAILLESAFASAYYNVEINLKSLQDKKNTELIRSELLEKEKIIKKVRQETEERVGKIIRG